MKRSFIIKIEMSCLLVGLAGLLTSTFTSFAGGEASFYSGQATVVRATVGGVQTVTISDTGPLPGSGGALEASLLSTNIAGLLGIEVCNASTVGQDSVSYADASCGKVNLTPAFGVSVQADALSSWALASCCTNGPMLGGSANIANLVINGTPINVSGQPNQTVDLIGGRVIINEQVTFLGTDSACITVNALHVIINGAADVIISSSHADIVCGGNSGGGGGGGAECSDKVTGGGWITGTPSGAKGNFGVAGGTMNGAFWGHLNYVDHGNGMHVKDTAVTGYQTDANDTDCRYISYNVTIDGAPGTAFVHVCDKGEPGRDDIFEITLSNGYHAGGDLGGSKPGGGNIQLHKCN